MKSLGERSLTAVFWGGGGAIFKIALQFGAMVSLARILGPEQYGLFAIGAIVVSFSGFFADFGIAYGLIQKREITRDDLRFVTTWQLLTGTLVTIIVVSSSSLLATLLGDPRAQMVIAALACVCFLNALAAPSLNLLKRAMDFKSIQIAQIAAYIAGFMLVGIPLALAGAKVWALVAAWFVQALTTLVILFVRSPHPIKPLIWFKGAGSVLQFGGTVLVTNLVNWIIGNIDRVVVARAFMSKDVGLYSSSYNMLYNPTASLLGVIQPVFFSATARIADDNKRITSAYLALMGCVAAFVVPAFAGLSAVASTFILALYGEAWREAGPLLAPIALVMPLFLAWGLTTPLVWAGGQPGREWKVQFPLALLWVAATWSASQVSPATVGWTVVGLAFVRFVAMLWAAMSLLRMGVRKLWEAVRGGLLLSVVCAMLMGTVDRSMMEWSGSGPMLRLAVDVLAGGVAMVSAMLLFPGLLAADAINIIAKMIARAPRPVAKLLQILLLRHHP